VGSISPVESGFDTLFTRQHNSQSNVGGLIAAQLFAAASRSTTRYRQKEIVSMVRLSMAQIHQLLRNEFDKYGYNTSCKGLLMDFWIGDQRGQFKIESANVKRFEISVFGKGNDFLIPCRENVEQVTGRKHIGSSIRASHYACKRFTKREDVMPSVLEWLANSVRHFHHLHELMDPEGDPPNAINFQPEEFITDGYGVRRGMLNRVLVQDVVTLRGKRVIKGACDPKAAPYFLITGDIHGRGREEFITDDRAWMPVITVKGEYRVFYDDRIVNSLAAMNKSDQQLIAEGIRRFVATHIEGKDKATDA
jgi:hypothetical protein